MDFNIGSETGHCTELPVHFDSYNVFTTASVSIENDIAIAGIIDNDVSTEQRAIVDTNGRK